MSKFLNSKLDHNINKQINARNTWPKFETVKPEKSWAFTVNPAEQHFEMADRLTIVREELIDNLKCEWASYKFYTELSPNGRIHFHGYIRIFNTVRFNLFMCSKIENYYTVKMEPVYDEEGWLVYITKQAHIMTLFDEENKTVLIPSLLFIDKATTFQTGKETKSYLSNRQQFNNGLAKTSRKHNIAGSQGDPSPSSDSV